MESRMVIKGFVNVRLWRGTELLRDDTYNNLITDAGDLYYAQRVLSGIAPANLPLPSKMNGMKLGTGNASVAKNGTGAALVSYLSGSNQTYDTGFPAIVNLGAGAGVYAQYQVTYQPGVATSNTINEAVIVNDPGANATSVAANTLCRIAFASPYVKGASDTLGITWNHLFLGS